MATPYILPEHLFTDPDARQQLVDGLEEACTLSCPLPLHEALGESDRRWDDLVSRAIQRALPEVSDLLETAIAQEYQRAPIAVEPALKAVPA